MLFHNLMAAIPAARTGACLDDLSRAIWTGLDRLTDGQAQALAEAIDARRKTLRGGQGVVRRKAQRPPVRGVAVERRRRLAASGVMPPVLASRFTTGELAALKIVADEIRAKGFCGLVLDAIAARAGVSKRTVQNALKAAESCGYVRITRRRIPGQLKNLPNVVRIVSAEWLAWLKVAKRFSPRVTRISSKEEAGRGFPSAKSPARIVSHGRHREDSGRRWGLPDEIDARLSAGCARHLRHGA